MVLCEDIILYYDWLILFFLIGYTKCDISHFKIFRSQRVKELAIARKIRHNEALKEVLELMAYADDVKKKI